MHLEPALAVLIAEHQAAPPWARREVHSLLLGDMIGIVTLKRERRYETESPR
jgi:hypothetical protein